MNRQATKSRALNSDGRGGTSTLLNFRQMFEVKLITASTTDLTLITRSEAKKHCIITHTDDDTYIDSLISQVMRSVENYCGIAIGSQEREWKFDTEEVDNKVPHGPVISIEAVSRKTPLYEYAALTENEDYEIDGNTLSLYKTGRFKVEYTCGYTTLPADLKLGILNEIAYRYTHRGEELGGGFSKDALELIKQYKDYSWL